MIDRTADSRAFKILNVIDEYTLECLAMIAAHTIRNQDVIDLLFQLFTFRGIMKHIRSDNGPQFTTKAVRRWLNRMGGETLFIERGSPWENGYIESFNVRVRDELLSRETFTALEEVKALTEQWPREYSQVRLHSALGYRHPVPEAILITT